MDLQTIVFLVSLFIMLTAAISTELVRSKRMSSFFQAIFFLNLLCFIAGVVLFVFTHGALYMVAGMIFSVGVFLVTIFKFNDF
jgi:hypothetical protein